MISALLLLAARPRLAVRVTTPARAIGLPRGYRLPPRKPPVEGRTWAARAVLTWNW